jgi:hypothetical protein
VTVGPATNCFNIVMLSLLKSGVIASERRIRQIFEYMDKCKQRTGRADLQHRNLIHQGRTPPPPPRGSDPLPLDLSLALKLLDVGGTRRANRIPPRLEEGYHIVQLGHQLLGNYWAKTPSINEHALAGEDAAVPTTAV